MGNWFSRRRRNEGVSQSESSEYMTVGPGNEALEDIHLLEVAQRITRKQELQHLGLKVLKVSANTIDSAFHNEAEIQDAAYRILQTWYHNQESKEEAYRNLYRGLVNNERQLWATELKKSVTGIIHLGPVPKHRFKDLQARVKDSLDSRFKDFLKHDWLEEGLNFSLMKYYTDLSWVRMVNEPMGKKRKPMESIDDILKVPEAGRKGVKILVEARSGMGKSSSMAYLAMQWVEDKTDAFPFDFVFLIPLRNVDKNCSLAKLVVDEHDLEKKDIDFVKSILNHNKKHKVLLLLDGYDEYTPGTNTELDQAIEKRSGCTLLILTSRPTDGKDFTQNIRQKMDGEVVIEGFSPENIEKCCSQYLGSHDEAKQFLKEVKKNVNLYQLLIVPIILLITSILYKEDDKKSLPERKTELYENLYEFIMDRSTLKSNNFGSYSSEVPKIKEMLLTLGKFAWEALQTDDKQLLIKKADLVVECKDIMKLGLLHASVKKASARKQAAYLSYEHKSLQEFGASKYVTERLETAENIQETLSELFPSWHAVKRNREVIIFTSGLMKDPTLLIQHAYEMQIENHLSEMRTSSLPSVDWDLFESLYSECTVPLPDHPLHNKFISYYDHPNDDHMKRPRDTTLVYFPSRVYHFWGIQKVPVLGDVKQQEAEIPECAMTIYMPDKAVTNGLFFLCRMISEQQPITDLYMWNVNCGQTTTEAPKVSKSMQSLTLCACTLPTSFMRDILQQLHDCVRLLSLQDMDLRQVEEDLDRLLNNLVSHHKMGSSQTKLRLVMTYNMLSKGFVMKWNERCRGISSIDSYIY